MAIEGIPGAFVSPEIAMRWLSAPMDFIPDDVKGMWQASGLADRSARG